MTDHHDALDRYLDDRANGRIPRDELHPGLVATIDQIAELGERPVPDRTFVDQLEDNLMNAVSTAPAGRRLTLIPDRPLAQQLPARPTVLGAAPHPWAPILISAALLLLTIGVAFGPLRPGNDGTGRSPAIPAAVVQASPSPEATEDPILLEVPVPADAVPEDGFGDVGMRFFVMTPNSTAAWTCEACPLYPGIWAQYVVAGSMTVTSDAALQVVRGDGSQEDVPAGTEIALEAGDTLLIRDGSAMEWTNAGSAEVQIISLAIPPLYAQTAPESNDWQETGYDIDYSAAFPAGDWVLRLETQELEPNGEIPAPASPSLQFGVAGPETDAYLASGAEGELTLRSADSTTTVYVMTLEQTSANPATPEP